MNIKQILKQTKISQSELAKIANVSKTTLNHIINLNKWPKHADAVKERIEAYLSNTHQINLIDDLWSTPTEIEENENMQKEMISQAARQQFGIFRDPFNDDVNTFEDVFLSSEQRYIRETLYLAAKSGGFVAVIGESGAGKSILRRDLIDRIARENLDIRIISPVMPDKTRLSAASIEDSIIYDLDEYAKPKRAQEAKARQMQKLLSDSSRAGNAHCLIIEEAHDLTLATLKQLKRFWEMEDGFKKLISIILIGQPELKSKLNERINFEAREVIRRCEIAELQPLGEKLGDYLAHKFKRVGADYAQIFTQEGIDAMQAKLTQSTRDKRFVSMTYPLIVNNLTVKALNMAAQLGASRIDAGIVGSL